MPFPAGGLFSTATDVSLFCRMILNGGVLDGKRYLSEKSLQQMTSTADRQSARGLRFWLVHRPAAWRLLRPWRRTQDGYAHLSPTATCNGLHGAAHGLAKRRWREDSPHVPAGGDSRLWHHSIRTSGNDSRKGGERAAGTSLPNLNALSDAEKAAGWKLVFDGKTLKGWHASAQTGHSRASGNKSGGRWVAENGMIVGSQDIPGNGGIFLTDEKFGDYEIALEMKNDFGPDSGLFLRCDEKGNCYQAMIDYHVGGNLMGLYGEGNLGAKPQRAELHLPGSARSHRTGD